MTTPLRTKYCRAGIKKPGMIRISLKLVNSFFMAAALVLGTYYLISVNDLSVKGFVLKELKSEVSLLESENIELQNRVSSLQSYDSVLTRINSLGMVAVGDMQYISKGQMAVAKR